MAKNIVEQSMRPEYRNSAKVLYKMTQSLGAADRITQSQVGKLLTDSIDMHVHGYPEALIETGWDFADLAKQAYDAGMRGIVLKSMCCSTVPMAYFIQHIIDKYAEEKRQREGINAHNFHVYGGVVLNYPVGGLNPKAVTTCAKLGGKVVWLPSIDAAHHKRVLGEPGGIELLSPDGKVLPELHEIIEIIAEHNLILATSHSSTFERMTIIEEARKAGVVKIIVTHPQLNVTRATVREQVEMARLGAYIGLFVYAALPHFNNPTCDRLEALEIIKKVGKDRIVIATDFGSALLPPPVEGLKLFIRTLLTLGVNQTSIEVMLKKNPSYLLDLES